jgi:RNA-dependent RNA polymerase
MKNVVKMIDDIETKDKQYCFTDGVGKMSWGIAALIAMKLNIKPKTKNDVPSAYQIRIAGCKGMLAIDPESKLDDYYIQIRSSMKKFESENWNLEICEYSKPCKSSMISFVKHLRIRLFLS